MAPDEKKQNHPPLGDIIDYLYPASMLGLVDYFDVDPSKRYDYFYRLNPKHRAIRGIKGVAKGLVGKGLGDFLFKPDDENVFDDVAATTLGLALVEGAESAFNYMTIPDRIKKLSRKFPELKDINLKSVDFNRGKLALEGLKKGLPFGAVMGLGSGLLAMLTKLRDAGEE